MNTKISKESKVIISSLQEKINAFSSASGSVAVPSILTIAELNTLRNDGLCDSSVAYQRSIKSAWLDLGFRGRVLDSIMRGWTLGVVYVVLRSDGKLEFIDGKQRLNFICTTLDLGLGFSGMSDDNLNQPFSSWSLVAREKFMAFPLQFCVFPAVLDDEDRRELFERLNAGINLSALDKRRGKILDIVTNPAISQSVKTIHGYMLDVAGKNPPSVDSAEEAVLQALSYIACDNADYTGNAIVTSLQNCEKSVLSSAILTLVERISAFGELWRGYAEEERKSNKWLVSKSTLNVILAIDPDPDGYDPLFFGSFKKSRDDKEAGTDQNEYKSFVGSASASAISVRGRIAILERVQNGTFTRNIAKDIPVPKPEKPAKADKTEKSKSAAKTEKLTLAEKQKIKADKKQKMLEDALNGVAELL